MEPLRLFVVDDHEVVRDGIQAMAARTDDIAFVGGAGSAHEAQAFLSDHPADIVLLDYRLGSESGFELCTQLREDFPDCLILIFTAFGNPELLTQAIRAGAAGYILKDTNTNRLPEILRDLREHRTYFDPRLAGEALVAAIGRAKANTAHSLGEREATVLRLIAEGKSNQEIAAELYLSPHTVKFQITRLLRKYNVRRRSELAKIAADMFLTS